MAGSIQSALTQTKNEFSQAMSTQKGSTLDKDSFMLLLVTQFQYQDPLNPMDDKEFISQMAQFSSLEQMMNMNESMEKMTEATNNQQMINATSYIGKLVSVTGNTIGKNTSNGETTVSSFRYAFGDNVIKGTLSVRDASGNTVYTEDLAGKQAGTTFEFTWNGKDNSGQACPDGVYIVSLAAYNAKGEAVLSDQVVDATVTGLVNQDGTIYLGMDGGQLLALANVRQVTTPKVVSTEEDKKEETESPDDPETSTGGDGDTSDSVGDASGSGTENTGGAADSGTGGDGSGSADSGTTDATQTPNA